MCRQGAAPGSYVAKGEALKASKRQPPPKTRNPLGLTRKGEPHQRPPEDYRVDRPELPAPQGVQATGTNRPRGLTTFFPCPHPQRRRQGKRSAKTPKHGTIPNHDAVAPGRENPTSRPSGCLSSPPPPGGQRLLPMKSTNRSTTPWLVTTARGKHPFPSRTRPLSPSAAMVLRRQAVGE